MPVQVAKWDSARDAWMDEGHISLFSGLSDAYLGTFPTSGMTVNGVAYELPTWERRMPGSASSSLLKTPTSQLAVDGGSQHPDKRKAGGHGPTLADEIEHLLPTVTARDWKSGGTPESYQERAETIAQPLSEIRNLLPTPQAHDAQKGKTAEQVAAMRARGHGVANLNEVAENELVKLLPTPAAMDGSGGRITKEKGGFRESGAKRSITLSTAVHHDLTPTLPHLED